MKQSQFESRHLLHWQRFREQLQSLEGGKANKSPVTDNAHFISDYRALCQQLALADARGYSSHLIADLQQLALRGHQQLYRHKSSIGVQLLRFFLVGFPQRVREEWRYILAACLLFFGSMLLMGILTWHFPDLLGLLLDPAQIAQFERMYNPADPRFGKVGPREAATNWTMFAHYIQNNIGIAFQTFASGILFCLGTLFFLLFNGLHIGSVAGYLTQTGSGEPFWSFVAAHSSFELSAIAIAGAAGLRLGMALLVPGRLPRSEALRLAARAAVGLAGGGAMLLLLAAFIEAYWSPTILAVPVLKYAIGILLWLLLLAYLCLAGRGMETAHATD